MKADRALFVSNLFPSSVEPGRGRFNLDQLVALRQAGLETTVIAPRPWFPGPRRRRTTTQPPFPPALETVESFRVYHRRAPYLPLWPGTLNARLYGWSALGACREVTRTFAPDFLWVSFAFPDAVGMTWVARHLHLPLVISVHGSDVNVSFRMQWRRRAMLTAFQNAACVLCKSAALRDTLVRAGTNPDHVSVVYNGVDRTSFYPRPKRAACRELGLDPERMRLLFVGNLVEVKGLSVLLDALRIMALRGGEAIDHVVVGDGPLRNALQSLAKRLCIDSSMRFVGRELRRRVGLWMAASDVLVLPSLDEGVPNVVIEAFAAGRPVVASAVGGVPEVHPGETAGALVPPRDPESLAAALARTLHRPWNEQSIARLAERFDWAQNAKTILATIRGLS